jgi:lysophospholipase L1-like esterase
MLKKSALAAPLTLMLAIGLATQGALPAQAAAESPARTAVLAAATTTTALRVEPFGGSFTYGSHSSTGNGYRGPLWNDLTSAGHPLDFVGSVHEGTMADNDNEGHPGYRIDSLEGLTGSIKNYKPNVVTLVTGTNDLLQNYDVANAPSRLSTLIDQILTNAPGATVLVGTLPAATNPTLVSYTPAYNAALPGVVQSKQAAGKHVALVDMGAITTGDLVSDGIHPDDNGYQKMGDAWNKGIQTALSAGWIGAPSPVAATAGTSGEVLSGIAGKCLDVNAGASTDGTAVQLWTCNHSGAQTWTVYTDNTLRSMGKCLDATGAGTANGTKAEIWTCNGTGAQLWQPYIGGSYINLASGRCLDDPGASTTDGTQLALWDCTGGANQQWAAAGVGPVILTNGSKCLDVFGGTNVNGTKADLWDCNRSGAQQWVFRYSTLQASSLCLDVVGAGTANGTLVDLWDCNGTANQVWQKGANGSLVNPASGKCLDDPGYDTTNGVQLDIWDCNGGDNQHWTTAS